MGLAVSVGSGVSVGAVVEVGGMGVSLGVLVAVNVDVNGIAVAGVGSVGNTVTAGNDVGDGMRGATFGTHRISPGRMSSLVRQLTFIISRVVVK